MKRRVFLLNPDKLDDMNNKNLKHILVIGGIILIAALSRLVPHYPNVTPIGSIALFGAAYFSRRYLAILVPLIAVIFSDLILYATIYSGFEYSFLNHIWIYAAVLLIALMGGRILRKVNAKSVISGSLAASALFFILTNFGAWLVTPMYPKTAAGLITAYEAGIPFFWNTMGGDLFYCAVLFGGYALLTRFVPSLAPATA